MGLGVLGAQVDLVGLAADGEADRLARFGAIEVVEQRPSFVPQR
jgi:hypothetical protein